MSTCNCQKKLSKICCFFYIDVKNELAMFLSGITLILTVYVSLLFLSPPPLTVVCLQE